MSLSKDITTIQKKPIWEVAPSRTEIKNVIASSAAIEVMVVEAAHEGLKATTARYDKYGDKLGDEPDFSTRHKYWRDILLMKKWLDKSDLNIDARSVTINDQEMDILRRYSGEDSA
jgi:hypothetical protein